jgi:hypothetical protein
MEVKTAVKNGQPDAHLFAAFRPNERPTLPIHRRPSIDETGANLDLEVRIPIRHSNQHPQPPGLGPVAPHGQDVILSRLQAGCPTI